jgi:hypothetical protein
MNLEKEFIQVYLEMIKAEKWSNVLSVHDNL